MFFRPGLRLALLLLTVSLAFAQSPRRPRSFAIRNVKIVAVSSAPIERGTVLIQDGLIAAVGPSVDVPAEAWVIDGDGLTAYPGFIHAMSALGMPKPPKGQPAGPPSTGPDDRPATTPWLRAADLFEPPDGALETWRSGGFTTLALAPQVGLFPGQVSLINLSAERPQKSVVLSNAAQVVRLPDRPEGYRGYPVSLLGRIAYVRQLFLDAVHSGRAQALYAANPNGLPRPEYDRALAPLWETLEAGRPILYPASDATEARRAIDLREIGEDVAIYGGQESYAEGLASELVAHGTSVLLDVAWPSAPKNPDPEDEPTLRVLEHRERAPSSAQALSKAGAVFALYSSKAANPREFLDSVRRAVETGWPSELAIRALTLHAARIYQLDDVMGSLEAGKIANVVLFREDPFAEKSKPAIVFIDGVKYDIQPDAPQPEEEKP